VGRVRAALALRPLQETATEADLKRLLHELQVHQIELEMQNDALQLTQAETHAALQQVTDIKIHLDELVAARTAELVAEANANVVEVVHTRHGKFQINEAELELHIETRGSAHRTAVMKKLTDAGYKIRVADDV
jgi:threonine dehydratase